MVARLFLCNNVSGVRKSFLLFVFPWIIFTQNIATGDEYHPFLVDSETVNWQSLETKYIEPDIEQAIEIAQKNIDKITSIPLDQVTFQNTIVALNNAENALATAFGYIGILTSTCDSPELRDAVVKIEQSMVEFSSYCDSNDALWERIKIFVESPEAQKLQGGDAKLLARYSDQLKNDLNRRSGKRLVEINKKLLEKYQTFRANILDARNAWEKYVADKKDLAGLSEKVIEMLRFDAEQHEHEGYRLSLRPDVFDACMTYLDSDDLRKEMYLAYTNSCRNGRYNNVQLARDIVRLRNDFAKIFGFQTYADCVLRKSMAKNGTTAMNFIDGIHDRILQYFDQENDELQKYYEQMTRTNAPIQPWQEQYWAEKLFSSKFGTEDNISQYFELNSVLNGMLEIAHQLYGITFVEQPTHCGERKDGAVSVWHDDVKYYQVFEENGDFIGGIYFDLYTRPSKHEGTWTNYVKYGYCDQDGTWHHPIALICANFTPPSDRPCLLSHSGTEMLFHEIGHALHHLFYRAPYIKINDDINILPDFSEMPSQFMQNFCWHPATLNILAKHYVTGEPMPQALMKKLIESRNFRSANKFMDRLYRAKMDLELHHNYKKYANGDIGKKLDKALAGYRTKFEDDVSSMSTFDYVFAHDYYAAQIYAYKWAEMLATDLFDRFEKFGVLDRKIGQEFREKILSGGQGEPSEILFRKFMRRDPNPEILFIKNELVKIIR